MVLGVAVTALLVLAVRSEAAVVAEPSLGALGAAAPVVSVLAA